MTSIALVLAPELAAPALPDRLHRLLRRVTAYRRHRRYPSARLERARALDRWAADTVRHRV